MSNEEEIEDELRDVLPDEALPPSSELEGGVVSVDDVLEALADPVRRLVLRHLRDEEVASVEELARQVAARERDVAPGEVTPEGREKAAIKLSHVHLAKLAELHLVEYDERSSTVRYADPPLLLEAVLRLLEQLEEGGG